MAGLRQMWQGMKEVWKLKQTLLYLLAFFLFNDTLNTMSTREW
jgi:MFS-type transporter involved in bile tolerance (Atg22 family)